MHYFKFNIATWNLSTAHLTVEEDGVYFRLVCHYYDTQSPIPLETQSVIRRLRLGSHEKTVNAILSEFFKKTAKGWTHARCELELTEYRKQAEKNRANGSKGGRPNKIKRLHVSHSEPNGIPNGLPNETQNNPNQELLTTNHKPLIKDSSRKFIKPTTDDLITAFTDKVLNPQAEANKFLNYYESNGWKVGRNAMKSWRHAVINWIGNCKDRPAAQQSQTLILRMTDTSWADPLLGEAINHNQR